MRGEAMNTTEVAVFEYLKARPCEAHAVADIARGLERQTEVEWLNQNVRRACYELWNANKIDVAKTEPSGAILNFYYFDPETCK